MHIKHQKWKRLTGVVGAILLRDHLWDGLRRKRGPIKETCSIIQRSEFEENYIIKERNSFIKQLSEHNWTAILGKSKWLRRETKAKSHQQKIAINSWSKTLQFVAPASTPPRSAFIGSCPPCTPDVRHVDITQVCILLNISVVS